MVAPIGKSVQTLKAIDRTGETEFQERELFGVQYIPLTEKDKQLGMAVWLKKWVGDRQRVQEWQ